MNLKEDKNKIIAIAATAAVSLVVLLILLFTDIRYEWPPKDMPLPEESEILFGGEYVMLGNIPVPASDKMEYSKSSPDNGSENQDAHDMVNSGEEADASKLISTNEESPMQTVDKPEEKPGPTKEELERQQREKYEKEKAKEISKRVSFNKKGKSEGKQGVANGNSEQGALNGAPGHSLVGRTIEYFERPSSKVDGKIVIRVRVNPKGYVIDAAYVDGSGTAAGNRAVRRSCVEASKNSRFSVAKNTTSDQIGEIVWRFE